jgi:putative endonuclease
VVSIRLSLSLKATQPPFENMRFYMAWMYILHCSDDSYYVGSTKNLEMRFSQHQSGQGSRYTSGRLPVQLIYCEEYDRVSDAFYREKQVQGSTRRKREALINGNPELLPKLAKKIFDKSKIRNNSVAE